MNLPSEPRAVKFTLLAEGSTDKALIGVLVWLLSVTLRPETTITSEFAAPNWPPTLSEKVRWTLENYPCDVLFIHRDADCPTADERRREIREAIDPQLRHPPVVCVVPVQETEAWFLFDEPAIRRASGNPEGRVALNLPNFAQMERLSDPKQRLREVLVQSSELTGRKRKKFLKEVRPHSVSRQIDDFSELRRLPAFRDLEEDVRVVVAALSPEASGPETT